MHVNVPILAQNNITPGESKVDKGTEQILPIVKAMKNILFSHPAFTGDIFTGPHNP